MLTAPALPRRDDASARHALQLWRRRASVAWVSPLSTTLYYYAPFHWDDAARQADGRGALFAMGGDAGLLDDCDAFTAPRGAHMTT